LLAKPQNEPHCSTGYRQIPIDFGKQSIDRRIVFVDNLIDFATDALQLNDASTLMRNTNREMVCESEKTNLARKVATTQQRIHWCSQVAIAQKDATSRNATPPTLQSAQFRKE
jgi:hypothetical protein